MIGQCRGAADHGDSLHHITDLNYLSDALQAVDGSSGRTPIGSVSGISCGHLDGCLTLSMFRHSISPMQWKLTQANAFIFRIVHLGNMPAVLASGCHCRSVAQGGYVEIGNQDLIGRRTTRVVPCGPGGTLSDYVPFYFTPFTPMLYNIKTGRGVPQKSMGDIAILVSSIPHLVKTGNPFVFTDRHAYLKAAQFSTNTEDLKWIIWPVLQARDFKKDDADKFEKYQAETLVHKHVPLDALLGIVCYNDAVAKALQIEAAKHGANVRITAESRWYV